MKRIHINNEFTQWAEYLARCFGHDLLIYDKEGKRMWGEPAHLSRPIEDLEQDNDVVKVIKNFDVIAYLDKCFLTSREKIILETIVPFIESQLDDDDEGA